MIIDGNEEHPDRGAWLQTFTGGRFYPFDPRPCEVNAIDIAHALSHICRFTGHARAPAHPHDPRGREVRVPQAPRVPDPFQVRRPTTMAKPVCEYISESHLIHIREDEGEFFISPENIVTIEDTSEDRDVKCSIETLGNGGSITLGETTLVQAVGVWAKAREARRP